MKYKLIAINQRDEGLLPMKQSAELEAKKSTEQQSIELCNFIKNSFVVDGDVSLIALDQRINFKTIFIVEDTKRGNFMVAIKKI